MAATVRQFQRMWSYDRTITIKKPLVTAPWRSFSFYALTGKSTISFDDRIIKETVCEALEEIREQNPPDRILLVADNYGSHHARLTQQRADKLGIETSPKTDSHHISEPSNSAVKSSENQGRKR